MGKTTAQWTLPLQAPAGPLGQAADPSGSLALCSQPAHSPHTPESPGLQPLIPPQGALLAASGACGRHRVPSLGTSPPQDQMHTADHGTTAPSPPAKPHTQGGRHRLPLSSRNSRLQACAWALQFVSTPVPQPPSPPSTVPASCKSRLLLLAPSRACGIEAGTGGSLRPP